MFQTKFLSSKVSNNLLISIYQINVLRIAHLSVIGMLNILPFRLDYHPDVRERTPCSFPTSQLDGRNVDRTHNEWQKSCLLCSSRNIHTPTTEGISRKSPPPPRIFHFLNPKITPPPLRNFQFPPWWGVWIFSGTTHWQTTSSSSSCTSGLSDNLNFNNSGYQFKQRMLCKIELTARNTYPLTLSMLAEFSLIIDACASLSNTVLMAFLE